MWQRTRFCAVSHPSLLVTLFEVRVLVHSCQVRLGAKRCRRHELFVCYCVNSLRKDRFAAAGRTTAPGKVSTLTDAQDAAKRCMWNASLASSMSADLLDFPPEREEPPKA
jgi:hypothetical protein